MSGPMIANPPIDHFIDVVSENATLRQWRACNGAGGTIGSRTHPREARVLIVSRPAKSVT